MDNSEIYILVPGHWEPGRFCRIGPRKPKLFDTPCKYCDETGKEPDLGSTALSLSIAPKCQACHGTTSLALEGSLEDYKPCGRCHERPGKDPDDIVRLKPCDICLGSGLARRRQIASSKS